MPKLSKRDLEYRSLTPEVDVDDIPANGASNSSKGFGASFNGDQYGEDIYEVEDLVGHKFVKGKLLYRVRWKGYSEKDDTYEPPENLLPESSILTAVYHESIGGTPEPERKNNKRKSKTNKNAASTPSPAKKSKRNPQTTEEIDSFNDEGSLSPQPYGNWLPKDAKWDDLIEQIETVERDDLGNLRAYIRFKNGKRTKVGQSQYYAHCPRKLLQFYEDHLNFK